MRTLQSMNPTISTKEQISSVEIDLTRDPHKDQQRDSQRDSQRDPEKMMMSPEREKHGDSPKTRHVKLLLQNMKQGRTYLGSKVGKVDMEALKQSTKKDKGMLQRREAYLYR